MYNISIIGSGNGGRAFAAYLSKKGYKVNLAFRDKRKIKSIYNYKMVQSEGEISGTFKLNLITNNYKKLVEQADIILLVVPAFAHKEIAARIAPYLHDGQIILLNPGRTWGAIEVYNIIKLKRPFLDIHVGETQTLLLTSRAVKDYGVQVLRIKDSTDFCFYSNYPNYDVYHTINEIFPELNPVYDIRITSLNNIGAMIHPATVVLNSGSIHRKQDFLFYREGVIPHISRIIEEIDKKRCMILDALGVKALSFLRWVEEVYNVRAQDFYEAFQKIPPYATIKAPKMLKKRYLTEDVPTGLVPLWSIAQYLNLPTPTIESIINLTDLLLNTEYKRTGRTVRRIGVPLKLLKPKSPIESVNDTLITIL
ncbi:MAG: NADP transhydrogenase subunit alpha [Candidatus Lokiarchaeota archaeon]|nr:NADP transhydrogenase subunit alpha [Candidatus Lokiarchaeota archaeon]